MSSQWTDCLQNHIYPNEIAPFISIVKEVLNKEFDTEDDFKDYLKSLSWKVRVGGKILKQGENKITTVKQDIKHKYLIKNSNYNWKTWIPALGDLIEIAPNKFSLQYEDESSILNVEITDEGEIITLNIPVKNKKMIRFLSLFRTALNKAAYCKNCRHCHRCLEMPKGCWITRSLTVGNEIDGVNLTRIDRYNTFGLRADWIRIFGVQFAAY